jgi:hypothetical protein
VQGPDSFNCNLNGLNIATYNQLLATQYTIAYAASHNIDLTNLTNLVNEMFAFTSVLTIVVIPTGASCQLKPGASNPCGWFFGTTTDSVMIPAGGMLAFSQPTAGPGFTVDGSHKILTVTNTGGSGMTLTVDVLILGSA